MLNYRKIAKVLVVAAFFCTFINMGNAWAQALPTPKGKTLDRQDLSNVNSSFADKAAATSGYVPYSPSKPATESYIDPTTKKKVVFSKSGTGKFVNLVDAKPEEVFSYTINDVRVSKAEYEAEKAKAANLTAPPKGSAGSNTPPKGGEINGCKKDLGMFDGLIKTGRTIFEGLRDLIYVVAGFGIIGVAVGGFFGNLNWKWLGALIIGLIVIATTGELINAITGCESFTSGMITDTLK